MAELILEARGLSFDYPGGVAALDRLDLGIRRGRKLAVLGPNGAGKSTVLLHLNGTLRPRSGRVLLDGVETAYSRAGLTRWRRRVGLVLQEPDDQLFAATVAEDVSFGPLNLGLGEATTRQRVDEALAALGIGDLADRATHMLSFGQKKRAAIAGALAMRPEVLLLDEPLAGLDRLGARRLLDALDRLATAGTTLVFSTHDVDLAWDFADDVALFAAGRVARSGPAAEVLADREALAQAGLEPPLLLELGVRTREEALARWRS
ncbi:energy-coupling factor ABC transporter ATP-binding protein [Magnetospirillum sp. SS-4]|uniref:energy-coupling factor ABC transporter ATP-binding protein n=1 Tax=Magnetospirillum sp. SS-4 TaxID=2681465 RepID=UPI0013841D8C|nr:ATP-binding cassette domain-containing protein [Magnetospirillum sp. SS-4]CAA7612353.1 Cobalt import ATP-binding protein CbiO [Magnetospirillum sp. SS-4]